MTMVYLREVKDTDIDLLFQWANDLVVRRNSFNPEPISFVDHQKWFARMMNDPSIIQFVLMEDKTPIGQIRLKLDNATAEIGYSIAREYRGRGYGHVILQLVKEEVQAHYPEIKELVAKVKPDNMMSRKLFESEGYGLKYHCYTSNPNK